MNEILKKPRPALKHITAVVNSSLLMMKDTDRNTKTMTISIPSEIFINIWLEKVFEANFKVSKRLQMSSKCADEEALWVDISFDNEAIQSISNTDEFEKQHMNIKSGIKLANNQIKTHIAFNKPVKKYIS